MTPYFAQPKLEDSNVLAFAQDIQLGQMLSTVVVLSKCLTPRDVEVLWTEEMEELLAYLAPGNPSLTAGIPRPERVSMPRAYLSPFSLVHPLMLSLFLSPYTVWHMMHAKDDATGITQRVTLLMEWLRSATVNP